jgi:hypothetical protein
MNGEPVFLSGSSGLFYVSVSLFGWTDSGGVIILFSVLYYTAASCSQFQF